MFLISVSDRKKKKKKKQTGSKNKAEGKVALRGHVAKELTSKVFLAVLATDLGLSED